LPTISKLISMTERMHCRLSFWVFSVFCALLVIFGSKIGEPSLTAAGSGPSTEQQLIKTNEELVGAEVRRDMTVLNDLFTDNYVHVHTNGWVESRTDFLNDFKSGKRIYHSVDLTNVHTNLYDKTALIMGNAHVRSSSGGEKDNLNRFLAVWVQERGKWRLAAWMTTRLDDPRTPWGEARASESSSDPK